MDANTAWNTIIAMGSVVGYVAGIGLFYYVSIVIHELGHMIAAVIVGWKPARLCLGYGKHRTVFSFGDVEFQLGTRLSGGMMFSYARSPDSFRARSFIVTLGGPLATGVLACLLAFLASETGSPNVSGSFSEIIGILFLTECWILVASLWPYLVDIGDQHVPSDGLHLWQALSAKRGDFEKSYVFHVIEITKLRLMKGRLAEAREEFERGARLGGIDQDQDKELGRRCTWISLVVEAGRLDDARSESRQLLSEHPVGSSSRLSALDHLACIPVFYGYRSFIPDALSFIDEAIAEAPDLITLKGTKGSILIESGDVETGLKLIANVQAQSASETDQAITAWYLALGFYKLGETTIAREKLGIARAKFPNCIVAARIEREIQTFQKAAPREESFASADAPA